MRPFQVLSSDESRVLEEVLRSTAKRLVGEGQAEWVHGRRAVRRLSPGAKKGWRPKMSDGELVLQLTDD